MSVFKNSASSCPKRFRSDINGLRAIAISAVLLFHFHVAGFGGGYVGVDMFFVISGYLMTSIIVSAGADFSVLGFYHARAWRIMPALTIFLVVLIVSGFLFLEPLGYRSLAVQSAAAAFFLSNFLFVFQSGYFAPAAESQWLLHTWTLSAEWQFYLIYPALFIIVWKLKLKRTWLIALLIAGFTLSLLAAVILANMQSRYAIAAFFLLPSRAFEMLAGGLVFFLAQCRCVQRLRHGPRRGLELIGLTTCLISMGTFDSNTPWPSFNALVPVVGTCCIILTDRNDAGLLRGHLFQLLGNWSYSIYLWHWPIIVLLRELSLNKSPAWIIAGIAASILIGALSYRWVELPSRSLYKRPDSGLALQALCGVALAVVLSSGAIWFTNGLPARASGDQALLLDAVAASGEREFPRNCNGLANGLLQPCPEVVMDERIAVVGDSHAMMWFPRFGFEKHGRIEFLAHSLCPPFPNYFDKTLESCGRFNDLVLDRVLSGPYRRIVYMSIWVPYLDAFASRSCHTTDIGCRPLDGTVQEDLLFADFYIGVRRLVNAGREVVIVLPIPAPHFDLPKALRNKDFFGEDADASRWLNPTKISAAETRVRAKLKRAAAFGAQIVDPRDFMCQGGRCPLVAEDGRALYSDGNHLRPWVVRERLNFLDAFVRGDLPSLSAAQ